MNEKRVRASEPSDAGERQDLRGVRNLKAPRDRGFSLGILWAVWFLASVGEDTYAEELLAQHGDVPYLRRLAQREQYRFRRGFWASVNA